MNTKNIFLKRAQITPFLIIGIIIILGVILIFVFRNSISNNINSNLSPETVEINNFVENCIKETGNNAIVYIGGTGGYLVPPENSYFDNLTLPVAYYLYNKENKMPSKEFIANEINNYMDSFIYFCTMEFRDLPEYSVNQSLVKTKSEILDNKVVFDVSYPISFSKNDKVYKLENFQVELPIRLGIIYNSAEELMENQMKETDSICFSCLYEISEKNKVKINMLDAKDSSVVFVIQDNSSKIDDKEYLFYFANKY